MGTADQENKLASVGDLVIKSKGMSKGMRGVVTNVIFNFTGTTIYIVNTPMGLLSWYSRHVKVVK